MHAPVTVLGHRRRVGLWLQGCTIACPGCASRDTWDADGGRSVDPRDVLAVVEELGRDCDGLTVSGGEPLEQAADLATLLRLLRTSDLALRRSWDVLLFTGLEADRWNAAQRACAQLADAVIAGPYRAGEPSQAPLRASANQRLLVHTDRGRERYGLDEAGDAPHLQVVVDDTGMAMIGLPRPGDLGRMERELRRRGVHLGEVSWRS
ncbi:4Fe-4S cluster-binding domain-containing protein [Actinomycetospora sp. NBRC 106375]|uniref:4Fe-4S cluster-binding domain-containing protein n=1 Tax=Actinomycetospora sp. NBRC 106375 TaxID=3032207 RepID=UPI0025541ED4|nr:4Fe-4S cluster-binding domain-containing protein [Actinomycetospora sp. NBRC 106375]